MISIVANFIRMGLRDKTTPTSTTPLIMANMSCAVATIFSSLALLSSSSPWTELFGHTKIHEHTKFLFSVIRTSHLFEHPCMGPKCRISDFCITMYIVIPPKSLNGTLAGDSPFQTLVVDFSSNL